jgi:hypothetical protein
MLPVTFGQTAGAGGGKKPWLLELAGCLGFVVWPLTGGVTVGRLSGMERREGSKQGMGMV